MHTPWAMTWPEKEQVLIYNCSPAWQALYGPSGANATIRAKREMSAKRETREREKLKLRAKCREMSRLPRLAHKPPIMQAI